MKNISLILGRCVETDNYTLGLLRKVGGSVIATTLENGFNQKKVPVGTYEVKFRKVLSKLTEKYQRKFKWFSYHLELQNVDNADYVYIHIGNTEKDTDACILVGNTLDLTPPTNAGFIGESTDRFKRLYLELREQLEEGGKVFTTIN